MDTADAGEAVGINQWLRSNRLKKLIPYFEDNEIEMEDLLQLSQTAIEFSCVSELCIYTEEHVINRFPCVYLTMH